MPVQHNYGTAGATGGGFSAIMGLQANFEGRWAEPKWCYQRRSPKTLKDPYGWYSMWSYGCRVDGGSLDYCGTRTMAQSDPFEPISCDDGPGCSANKFIKGTIVDVSDVPVAGAIVQAFRTSDDVYLGQDQSREDGTYTVGTDSVAGTQHYLVAYKPGSPDTAGTTVNTLTATNVDGS